MKKGYTRFQEGDVVLAKITPSMENGKAAIAVNLVSGIGAGTTELHVIRPHDEINGRYLLHHLLQVSFRRRARSRMTGTAGQLRVPTQFLEEERLPIPPTQAQHRIVEALESHLSRLDAAVASLERVQRNLKRYRASVLQAAVEGRLVPTEAELARQEGRTYEPASKLLDRILVERRRQWIEREAEKARAKAEAQAKEAGKRWTGADNTALLEKARAVAAKKYVEPVAPDTTNLPELPEGWCWASLEQVLVESLSNGRSVPTKDDGFPVLRLTAITGDTIDLNERKGGEWNAEDAGPYLIQCGDILVARGNGSLRLVGRGALVGQTPNPVAYPDTIIRLRLPVSHLVPRFFLVMWNASLVRKQLERKAKTTAGIYKVNQGDLETTCVPIPPQAEQVRLLEVIEALDTGAANCLAAASLSETRIHCLRQSILRWAFEGKLVDQDPSDEPAAVLLERIKAERAATAPQKKAAPRRVKQKASVA